MARSLGIRRDREYWLNQILIEIQMNGVSKLGEIREDIQRRIGEQRSTATEDEERHAREIAENDRLYKAICDNKWEIAKALLEEKPNALTSKITASGKTPFHVAALFGHANIMEELLKLLEDPEFLETVDDIGSTPLLIASVTGITQVAKCLVDKNPYLLAIPSYLTCELPVTSAFRSGHHEMGRYLYSQTPLEYLQPRYFGHPLGPTLLRYCLQTQCFDIAHHLLSQCQELLFASDFKAWEPIHSIATITSTIPSPTELVFWKRWIYDYIDTNSTPSFQSAFLPIQNEAEDTRERKQGKLTGPGIKKIKEMKLQQAQANELVDLLCRNASKRDGNITSALFVAAKEGNVEFVVKVSNANPEILLTVDNSRQSIFYHAIEHRQARVFNLIHGLRFKDVFACSKDNNGNTLLHAAAAKAPDIILNRIYGPALQMQRELQWFKEVESITPSSFRVLQNNEGMTAEASFRQHHRELMKQGEEWIKETASSYSLVGILIVTITFAVVFTLPGGNDQNSGLPLFIKQPSFNVFILSTIVSLVASSTSVLMFLAILTSPFSEEAFLNFLPSKLLFGVSTLLISMVAMIITFLSAIHLTLKHSNYHGAMLPIILFTSVPISYSLLSLIPVIRNTAFSAYGTVFNRKAGLLQISL
ncbi:uncharacterized protein LOC114749695 [Neltuma alba]|uniref:uncharacterized protein LOC114749695 n=1 Tax=Neltuma alba TaxID=207710 RepID=UPI0010A49F01|nr:uncharacterized protein LOC114749695 [Prosopis alba]